jgi:hypothetical protein
VRGENGEGGISGYYFEPPEFINKGELALSLALSLSLSLSVSE